MFDDDNFGGCGGSMFNDSFGSSSSMFDDSSCSTTSMFEDTSISCGPDMNDMMFNPVYSWNPLSIFHKD